MCVCVAQPNLIWTPCKNVTLRHFIWNGHEGNRTIQVHLTVELNRCEIPLAHACSMLAPDQAMAGPKYWNSYIPWIQICPNSHQVSRWWMLENIAIAQFERWIEKCIIASNGGQRTAARARHEEIIHYRNLCEKCATIRIAQY